MNLLQRWRQTSLPNKLLVEVGAIAALSALLCAGLLGAQLWLNDKSSKELSAQVDKLITAGNAMVGTLQSGNAQQTKTLEAQREAMKLERRAWVGAVAVHNIRLEAGKPFGLTVHIKNSGATPARITSSRLRTRAFVIPERFVAEYEQAPGPPSRAVHSA